MRLAIALIVLSVPALAQMTFKDAEVRTAYGTAEQGDNGSLVVDPQSVKSTKGESDRFTIPTKAVTELFYSRVSGRRIKTAVIVAPWIAFTKGRKHYLTISFNDGGALAGAVEFQLHKNNYRGAIRALEEVTGVVSKYDEEGNRGQGMATRGVDAGQVPEQGILIINSTPPGADVYIDGDFNGLTPRRKALPAAEYELRLEKRGLATKTVTVSIEPGETNELTIELSTAAP